MAAYCSTGQSPQRAVVLMEEEEEVSYMLFCLLFISNIKSFGDCVNTHPLVPCLCYCPVDGFVHGLKELRDWNELSCHIST
jgi:hypothetical protein